MPKNIDLQGVVLDYLLFSYVRVIPVYLQLFPPHRLNPAHWQFIGQAPVALILLFYLSAIWSMT